MKKLYIVFSMSLLLIGFGLLMVPDMAQAYYGNNYGHTGDSSGYSNYLHYNPLPYYSNNSYNNSYYSTYYYDRGNNYGHTGDSNNNSSYNNSYYSTSYSNSSSYGDGSHNNGYGNRYYCYHRC